VKFNGVLGTVAGTTVLDTTALEPMSLTELILKVYNVPFVKPVIVTGLLVIGEGITTPGVGHVII